MNSDTPLWHFTYSSRPPAEEKAYREHFLDSDIKQLSSSVYVITAFLAALTLFDLFRLYAEPGLLSGIVVKIIFFILSLGVARFCARMRQPAVLDLSVLLYTLLYVIAILFSHAINDYSPARITAVIAVFIYTGHIALPVYAGYLLPAVALLIVGESAILFTTDRADLLLDRTIMLIVFLFAEFISVLASALHQRSRYKAFQALGQVKMLSGFLPICAGCKKIRNDDGYYHQIEQYISAHSEAKFTHGICPTCAQELYGEIGKNR